MQNKWTRGDSDLLGLDSRARRLAERAGSAPAPAYGAADDAEMDDAELDASGDDNSANGSEAIGADDGEAMACGGCGAPVAADEDGNYSYAGPTPKNSPKLTCPHCGAPLSYQAGADDDDDNGDDDGDEMASDGGDAQHYDGDDAAEFSGVQIRPRHDEEPDGAVAKCSACAQHTRLTDLTSLPIKCRCGHPFSTRDVRFTAAAKEEFDRIVARATRWRERRF